MMLQAKTGRTQSLQLKHLSPQVKNKMLQQQKSQLKRHPRIVLHNSMQRSHS